MTHKPLYPFRPISTPPPAVGQYITATIREGQPDAHGVRRAVYVKQVREFDGVNWLPDENFTCWHMGAR
jgi:hypothetical protein